MTKDRDNGIVRCSYGGLNANAVAARGTDRVLASENGSWPAIIGLPTRLPLEPLHSTLLATACSNRGSSLCLILTFLSLVSVIMALPHSIRSSPNPAHLPHQRLRLMARSVRSV